MINQSVRKLVDMFGFVYSSLELTYWVIFLAIVCKLMSSPQYMAFMQIITSCILELESIWRSLKFACHYLADEKESQRRYKGQKWRIIE